MKRAIGFAFDGEATSGAPATAQAEAGLLSLHDLPSHHHLLIWSGPFERAAS
jgi:hypothetical protein